MRKSESDSFEILFTEGERDMPVLQVLDNGGQTPTEKQLSKPENPANIEKTSAEMIEVVPSENSESLSYTTTAKRTISFWFNEFAFKDTNSHIITGLFLGMIPHESADTIVNFVQNVNPTRPLGLVVSVVEANELDGKGFIGAKMVSPKEWQDKGIKQHLVTMEDFTANVDTAAAIETVMKMRNSILAGYSVFVHCKAGRSRSAMFCAIYLSLFVINPETNEKYTLKEAVVCLMNARPQVKLGRSKLNKGQELINTFKSSKKGSAYLEADSKVLAESQMKFDEHLGSKALKDQILDLPAIAELIGYKSTVQEQHTKGKYSRIDFTKTPKRCGYVDQVCALIAKPHSEEWYYKLQSQTGPFKALMDSSPKITARNDHVDKEVRKTLITNLQVQVGECIQRHLEVEPTHSNEWTPLV